MPYQQGARLPGERASKLGHLQVLQSPLVNQIVKEFDYPTEQDGDPSGTVWREICGDAEPLGLWFAVDGSLQVVVSDGFPRREVAFVKTAMLRVDPRAIATLDHDLPHPSALRKIMSESALYHSTVFPLKNIAIPGRAYTDAMRRIVFDSLRDPTLQARPYDALKWLLYQQWLPDMHSPSPEFQCPHCLEQVPGLPYGVDEGKCPQCRGHLYVSDVLGLHMEMEEESASMSFASSYMLIHELLMILTGIRHYWDHNRRVLGEALFIKDGPLSLRGQYSKIVPLLRDFLCYARDRGTDVHLLGQEKSGAFYDHLQGVQRFVGPQRVDERGVYAILSQDYIRREIQRMPTRANPYGLKTNYGGKLFLKPTHLHSMVLNVPLIEYLEDRDSPSRSTDFIGFDRILATVPRLLSHRYEGGLLPVELANGVASLSSYPSAAILKVLAGI